MAFLTVAFAFELGNLGIMTSFKSAMVLFQDFQAGDLVLGGAHLLDEIVSEGAVPGSTDVGVALVWSGRQAAHRMWWTSSFSIRLW